MRKFRLVLGLLILSALGLVLLNQQNLTSNNRFVFYVVIFCINLIAIIILYVNNNKLLRNMLLAIFGMTAFSFVLVPLYDVFCTVTGLNGKLDLTVAAAASKQIDLSRSITVEFVVSQNRAMPWEFRPKHYEMVLHPGQLATTAYFAKNTTDHTMYAQAIPSITPQIARKYFKKVECFCFNKQKLGPGEAAHLGLRFYLDPAIPKDIHRVTLAYTIFDISQQEQ